MSETDLVPAAIRRSPTGRLVVSVAEMVLCEDPTLAAAVSRLCTYSVRAQVPLIATVASGAGKRHLLIGVDGVVHPVAAPAPSRTDYVPVPLPDQRRDLGESETDDLTSAEWVDRFILDPSAGEEEPPVRRRRRIFGRN